MTRIQTIFCFSVREPDTALSPLAIHFECVQISVFSYIFVIVDRSKANTWKCLRGKHLTSNTLKTWRALAITSAALGRLFDARLVRPPLQAHTKAVQLAKKGQVNNVLPSWKLNETSMLRLQTVVQSTLFPKKKSPRLEKLWKPPQGALKLASFDTVLAVRTLAVTFFFLRRTCSCRLSASSSSHLTPDQLVLSNTVLQPNKKAFRQPSTGSRWHGSTACRAGSIECRTTACAGACIEHSAGGASNSAVELVLVWTRIRVSIMFFLRVLSLDTSSSTYFPLFQLALRPASTPDSNRRWSSISPPRNHVAFSLAKQVSFEHSISSPSLLLLREGKKNIQTNDRQITRQKVSPQFVVDPSSARPDRDRNQRCSAVTSLATASTGTVLLPSQMSQIAGHDFQMTSLAFVFQF